MCMCMRGTGEYLGQQLFLGTWPALHKDVKVSSHVAHRQQKISALKKRNDSFEWNLHLRTPHPKTTVQHYQVYGIQYTTYT